MARCWSTPPVAVVPEVCAADDASRDGESFTSHGVSYRYYFGVQERQIIREIKGSDVGERRGLNQREESEVTVVCDKVNAGEVSFGVAHALDDES